MGNLNKNLPTTTLSSFGGEAALLQIVPVDFIVEQYKRKCGINVSPSFGSLRHIGLYECAETGYKFWYPEEIAGDKVFYSDISHAWKSYYRTDRWEYSHVRKFLTGKECLLEVGCGKGYFLRSIETRVKFAMGLEFNEEAIRNKVTAADVLHMSIEEAAATGRKFDVVCAFQVLEHITNPCLFIEQALICLNDGGTLILSTPNNESSGFLNQQDIFDAPPHHMGHFTVKVYENIAKRLNCTILKTVIQPRTATLSTTTQNTSRSVFHRAVSLAARVLLNMSYRLNKEPGDTVLIFMQKNRYQ